MLHITIIIHILLTFPTIPNTVSAVSLTVWQTINHSSSSTYDLYRCGYTSLGILISWSLTFQYFTHARYLNVDQITTFLLSTFQTFLVVCFQNITTCFLCFSFSYGLLFFSPYVTFTNTILSFFIISYNILKLFCNLPFLGFFFNARVIHLNYSW